MYISERGSTGKFSMRFPTNIHLLFSLLLYYWTISKSHQKLKEKLWEKKLKLRIFYPLAYWGKHYSTQFEQWNTTLRGHSVWGPLFHNTVVKRAWMQKQGRSRISISNTEHSDTLQKAHYHFLFMEEVPSNLNSPLAGLR